MKNYSQLLPGFQKYKEMMDENPREENCKCPHILLFILGVIALIFWILIDQICANLITTFLCMVFALYPISILIERNKNNKKLDKEFHSILTEAGFEPDEKIFDTREFLISIFLTRYTNPDLEDYIYECIEKRTNFIGQNLSDLRFSCNLDALLKIIFEIECEIEAQLNQE